MRPRSGIFRNAVVALFLPVLLSVGAMPALAQSADFDLQGHRGARGLAPENSMPGFVRALEVGVTTLELDLVVSSDDILIVHHDRRLDINRTRDEDGNWLEKGRHDVPVNSVSSSVLRKLDIGRLKPGSKVAARFPEQQGMDRVSIPRLVDLLYLAELRTNRTIRYNMELKHSPLDREASSRPVKMVDLMVKAIRENGIVERATVQSFNWRILDLLAKKAPEIKRVYLTAEQEWLDNLGRGQPGHSVWLGDNPPDWSETTVPQAIAARGGAVWSPYHRDLQQSDLTEARELGLKTVVWTVNDPKDMKRLITWGVDGIITDYPDRLRKVMAGLGMALPTQFNLP